MLNAFKAVEEMLLPCWHLIFSFVGKNIKTKIMLQAIEASK